MEKIEIRVGKKRNAIEINSSSAGRELTIDEIELGAGHHRKSIKYTNGFLQEGAECKAVLIGEGKVKIVTA